MKLFECQNCAQPIYFDNTYCERCGMRLGFLPSAACLSAVVADGNHWHPMAAPDQRLRFCRNAQHGVCNWLLEGGTDGDLCLTCQYNRIIPDLAVGANLDRWRKIELAKHRLFYSVIRLGLPLPEPTSNTDNALEFDFLGEPIGAGGAVMTGHSNGLITMNIAEADDAERERRRTQMGEPYRTLLGHFRHEIGHYYWDRLVKNTTALPGFRGMFGDERADYDQALHRHYADGAPADWRDRFVSTYATSHPWEDFAETWAHYLHIVDTLETARSFGMKVQPRIRAGTDLSAEVTFDPYASVGMEAIIEAWLPLTYAMNSLNRSMGQPDIYPFVLAPAAIEKLTWIHDLVRDR